MAEHVCPVWVGHLLASPIRKIFQDPYKILGAYISRGKQVLDAGSAMGYFSLAMAEVVKPTGKVYSVDLQEEMLTRLRMKAGKKHLNDYIETIKCSETNLKIDHLEGKIDFALVFAVLHEVPDQAQFLTQVYKSLRSGGLMLFAEPKGHVSPAQFEKSMEIAEKIGFASETCPDIKRSHAVLMSKDHKEFF